MKKVILAISSVIMLFLLTNKCLAQLHWQAMNNAFPPSNTNWVGVDANGFKLAIARTDLRKADPAHYSQYDSWTVIGKARTDWRTGCFFNQLLKSEVWLANYEILTDAENSIWKWQASNAAVSAKLIKVGYNHANNSNSIDSVGIAKMTVNDLMRYANSHDTKKRNLIANNNAIVIGTYDARLGSAWFTYGGEALGVQASANGLMVLVSNKSPNPVPPVVTESTENSASGLPYHVFYQNPSTANNRKGIILLAHGDGGSINDATLNAQCRALANEGYVAATITYRSLDQYDWNTSIANYKADLEGYITATTTKYNIPRSNVILGGSSRGSNELFYVLLPGQGNGNNLITGIKAAILECAGGDNWKGSAFTVPVAFMANKIDNVQGSTSQEFCNGLQQNSNTTVRNQSSCLIIPGTGHCSDPSNQYTPFIVQKVKSWLP